MARKALTSFADLHAARDPHLDRVPPSYKFIVLQIKALCGEIEDISHFIYNLAIRGSRYRGKDLGI